MKLKVRGKRETKTRYEDREHRTSCETIDETGAGTRMLDETKREREHYGDNEDAMPGTLRPGLTRRDERARESEVIKGRRQRGKRALLEDARR